LKRSRGWAGLRTRKWGAENLRHCCEVQGKEEGGSYKGRPRSCVEEKRSTRSVRGGKSKTGS